MKTICLVLIIIVSFFPQPFMTQNALSLETNQNNGSYIAYHSSTAIATSTYNNRRNGLKFDILYTNYSRLEPPWVSDFNFSYYVFWANRNITDGWVEGTTAYNKTINITYPDIYITLNNVTKSLYTQLGRSEGTVLRRFSMSCELAYINISYLNEAESRFNEIYNLYLNTTTGFPKNGPTDTRTNLLDWWTGLYFLYNLTNNNTYYYWLKKSIDTYISLCNETMFLSGDKIESDGTIINNPSTYDGYHNIGWSAHYFFTLVRIMQRLPGIVNETQKYYLADSIRRTLDLIYCNYSWGYFYYEFYAPLTGEVDNYYSTPRDVFAASVAIFDWARKILNNATFDEMVDNCTMSLDAYWREGYHFKWREDDTDLGSYDSFVAWAYNLLGANATRSRMHMLLSLLVGVAGPEIFYKTYDLPDISASHVSWSGYWSWSSGITKFVLSRAIGSYRYAKNLIPYPYPYISHYLNSILSKCFVSDGLRIKYSSTWEYGVARGIGIEDEVFSLYNLRLYNDTMHAASGIISSFRFSNLSTDNIILVYDLYLPDGLSMIYLPGVHNVSIEFYGNNSPIRYVSFVDDVIAFYSLSEQRVSLCIYVNAGKSYSYREDIDGDLLPDAFEVLYGVTNMNDDLDNDGLPNDWEAIFYSDPFDNDTDNDNISDLEEFYYTTNLLLPDSDYDGIYDSQEISWGYNPLNRHTISWKYTDYLYGIVLANKSGGFNWTEYYASLDTDNDAITNMEEYDLEYNPYDPVNKYFNIISPVWGQKFEGKSDIYVEWDYSGMYIEYFNIYLNGTFMQSTTSNDTILTNIGDGIWNVTVAGFAHASMVASDCVIIYVYPKLCVLSPENDSYLSGVVDIQFDVSSENISKVIVYLNATNSDYLLYESDTNNTHFFELNTSEYSDGQYTFTFFANNTYSLGS
ncbi:MAG: Ig-like domain-containing protein, partial [Candidatus Njordarchaeota archaeon]